MKTFTIDKFIEYTKECSTEWINYCEVLMTKSGDIILARPSHAEAAIQYAVNVEQKSVDEVKDFLRKEMLSPVEFYAGKYRLLSIWYDCIVADSLTDFTRYQEDSLKKLKDAGLISSGYQIQRSREYCNYLIRNHHRN